MLIVNHAIVLLTILVQGTIIFLLASFFLPKKLKNSIFVFFSDHAFLFSFVVSFFATVTSLYYSEVLGYEPCVLCWYQRIFLFPQVFLFVIGFKRKEKGIVDVGIVFSTIGAILSLYQYLLQLGIVPTFVCNASSAFCIKRFVFEFGYITIPLMAFTTFILLLLLMILVKIRGKKSKT